MADEAVVHIGENSPEHVAYRLLRDVAWAEGMAKSTGHMFETDRKWILDTYAECLGAVKSGRVWQE